MMRTLAILLLSLQIACAGITSMMVESIGAQGDKAVSVKVTAYGLLENGAPRVFTLTSNSDRLQSSKVENCTWEDKGFNRLSLRYWVYFYSVDAIDGEGKVVAKAGSIQKIDFHLSETFAQKVFPNSEYPELSSQMVTEITALKALIESK